MKEGFEIWVLLFFLTIGAAIGMITTLIIFTTTGDREPTVKYQPKERIEVVIIDNRE